MARRTSRFIKNAARSSKARSAKEHLRNVGQYAKDNARKEARLSAKKSGTQYEEPFDRSNKVTVAADSFLSGFRKNTDLTSVFTSAAQQLLSLVSRSKKMQGVTSKANSWFNKSFSASDRKELKKAGRMLKGAMHNAEKPTSFNKALEPGVEAIVEHKRRRDISRAVLNRAAGQSEFERDVQSLFYVATQHYWQGADPKDYDAMIMKGLNVDTIEEAIEKVGKSKKFKEGLIVLKRAHGMKLTDTEEDWFNEQEFVFDPDYIQSAAFDWVRF